jgi:hypothetical protein
MFDWQTLAETDYLVPAALIKSGYDDILPISCPYGTFECRLFKCEINCPVRDNISVENRFTN